MLGGAVLAIILASPSILVAATNCEDDVPHTNYGSSIVRQMGHGCSKPGCYVRQHSAPTANGCGSGFEVTAGFKFRPACMFHDVCYARCIDPSINGGEPLMQKDCDTIFLNLMYEMCGDWKFMCDYTNCTTGQGWVSEDECRMQAYAFYLVVRQSFAFTSAVEKRCECSSEKPATLNSTWKEHLLKDMQTNSNNSKSYKPIEHTLKCILSDPKLFNGYVAGSMKLVNRSNVTNVTSKMQSDMTKATLHECRLDQELSSSAIHARGFWHFAVLVPLITIVAA